MPPRNAIPWLVWGGAACGCIVLLALAMVLGTTWLTARIAVQHLARSLARGEVPAAGAPRPLEADITVVSAEGRALAAGSGGGVAVGQARFRYTVRLRNAGKSALLVQCVQVRLLDAAGAELAQSQLRGLVVVPGAVREYSGLAELPANVAQRVATVKAEVIPTI